MLPLSGDADNQAKLAIPPGLDAGNGILHDHGAHWSYPKPCSGCEEVIRGGLACELEAGEIHPVDTRLKEISEASGFEDLCTVLARGDDGRLEASLPQCADERHGGVEHFDTLHLEQFQEDGVFAIAQAANSFLRRIIRGLPVGDRYPPRLQEAFDPCIAWLAVDIPSVIGG
jgi:hypothetical protein